MSVIVNARKSAMELSLRLCSTSTRFGNSVGHSGWNWEKGGVGMGGKDKNIGCEARLKEGVYKVPEYYGYDNYSYFDEEIEMAKHRLPQPNSNMTKFW